MCDKAKLDSMAEKAVENLHRELYPKELGKKIEARHIETRLVIIATYEGYVKALKELYEYMGLPTTNIKELEDVITEEAGKTLE